MESLDEGWVDLDNEIIYRKGDGECGKPRSASLHCVFIGVSLPIFGVGRGWIKR